MITTPRSRVRALSGALSRSSPSQLTVSPTLRPSPSLSNFNHLLDSSASSVIEMDPGEGILIHDIDAEVDQTDAENVEVFVSTSTDEQKQLLRDQLRRSLSHRAVRSGQQLGL